MCKIVTFTGPIGDPDQEIVLDGDLTIHEALIELEKRYPALFCDAQPGTPGEGVFPAGKRFRMPTIAVLGGEPVLQGQWHVRRLRADETLGLVAIPRGGGGGNNTGKQVATAIAMIAVTIAAPYAGPAIAGALGFTSTLAGNVATAAFALAGSALITAVLRPQVETPRGPDSVYSVNGGSNQLLPFKPRWVLYGKLRYAPPAAMRPWSSYSDNDQYLRMLLWATEGHATINKIEFGDTAAWQDGALTGSFSDIQVQIVEPGAAVTLFPTSVVTSDEVAGLEISDTANQVLGPYTINAAGTQIKRVWFDIAFPEGLYRMSDDGDIGVAGRIIKLEVREIDDSGLPVGSWLLVESFNYRGMTQTPQRRSRGYDVTPGRYEARVTPLDSGSLTRVWNSASWIGLRGWIDGDEPMPNSTRIAIEIRANEQLSALVSNQVNVTATRKLPVWDGVSWTAPQETRSISWAVADMLRNSDYSAGYADTEFDLSWLYTYASFFEGRDDHFDAVFDRAWTLRDAVSAALRCGRSQMIRLGNQIGFTRYEAKNIRRAHFTARDIVKGSFEENPILFSDDMPDSILAQYIDARTWRGDEVKATVAAIGGSKPVERDYFGITDRDHAWREAVTDTAVNAFCRRPIKFTTEWSGKILTRGEPILVSHPLLSAVASAGIVSVSGNTVTLDHDATSALEEPATHLYVRGKKGKEWGPCLISSMPDGETVVLDATDKSAVEAVDGTLASVLPGANARKRAVGVLSNADAQPFHALVRTVKPNGLHRVEIEAVNDAAEPYTADGTETTPPDYLLPILFNVPGIPGAPVIYAYATNALLEIKLVIGWSAMPGGLRYVAQIRFSNEGNWDTVFDGPGTGTIVFVPPIDPAESPQPSLYVRVRAIGSQGPGKWTTKEITADNIPTPSLVPGRIVDSRNVSLQAILTENLANLAVNAAKLADAAIITSKLNPGAVTTEMLADLAVEAGKLGSGSVVADKLANNSVLTAAIADLAVLSSKLADAAVTVNKIQAGAVSSAKIADLAVLGTKIASGSVSLAKMAANAVDSTILADLAVLSTKLAANAVTTAKLADNAVTGAKLGSGAVDLTKFATGIRPVEIVAALPTTGNIAGRTVMLTTDNKLYRHTGSPTGSAGFTAVVPAADVTGQLTDAQIAAVAAAKVTGQITATQITDGAISTPKLAAGAVTANEIAANAVIAAKIAADAVTAVKIQAGAVSTAKLAANAVTANELAANAVTAAKIQAGAVSTTALAANSVTATQIAAGAVVTAKLAAGAVTTNELAAGAVVADKIAANVIAARHLVISDTSNVVADNQMGDIASWAGTSSWIFVAGSHSGTFASKNHASYGADGLGGFSTNLQTPTFAVEDGRQYRLRVQHFSSGGARNVRILFRSLDASGAFLSDIAVTTGFQNFAAGTATTTADITVPAGTAQCQILFTVQNDIAATVRTGGWSLRLKTTAELIVDGTIIASKIAAGAIGTNELAANSVAAGKIAADAVTATQIAAGAVTTAKLAAGAVTASTIAANAITASKVIVADVVNIIPDPRIDDVSAWSQGTGWSRVAVGNNAYKVPAIWKWTYDGLGSPSYSDPLWTKQFLVDDAKSYQFTWTQLRGGGVGHVLSRLTWYDGLGVVISTTTLYDGTIAAGHEVKTFSATPPANAASAAWEFRAQRVVSNGDVYVYAFMARIRANAELIVDGAVIAAKIATDAVVANAIAANAVAAGKIAAGAVTTAELAAGAVTAAKIAAGAITATQIAAGTILASNISVGTITADRIISTGIQDPKFTSCNVTKGVTSWAAYTTLASYTQDVTAESNRLDVFGQAKFSINAPAGGTTLQYRVLVGASVLDGCSGTITVPASTNVVENRVLIDSIQPGAGTATVSFQVRVTAGGVESDNVTARIFGNAPKR